MTAACRIRDNLIKGLFLCHAGDGRDRSSGRSGEWSANVGARGAVRNPLMACDSHLILTDRPEVGPCPRRRLHHAGTQACFAPCVTSPLPAKKSTKLGEGGFMRSFEQLKGGFSKGDFGERELSQFFGAVVELNSGKSRSRVARTVGLGSFPFSEKRWAISSRTMAQRSA